MKQPVHQPGRRLSRFSGFCLFAVAGLVAAGCGGDAGSPAPTPSRTRTPVPAPAPAHEPAPVPVRLENPSDLRVVRLPAGVGVRLSWQAVEGAAAYEVRRKMPDADWAPVTCSGDPDAPTACTVTGSSADSGALFRVRAVPADDDNTRSPSRWTIPVGLPVAPSPSPATGELSMPQGLRASVVAPDFIKLWWRAVEGAAAYEVRAAVFGTTPKLVQCLDSDGPNACTVTGLTGKTRYSFGVRAVPADDDSARSPSLWSRVGATTTAPPTPTIPIPPPPKFPEPPKPPTLPKPPKVTLPEPPKVTLPKPPKITVPKPPSIPEPKIPKPPTIPEPKIPIPPTIPTPKPPAITPEPTPATAPPCAVDLVLEPGDACLYPGTSAIFAIDETNMARFLFVSSSQRIDVVIESLDGVPVRLVASRQGDGTWLVEQMGG